MICFLRALLVAACLLCVQTSAQAQDYQTLDWAFDADRVSENDRRFVQLALSFEGYYQGLLDGDWGNISQSALESFTLETFDVRPPTFGHVAALTVDIISALVSEGWQVEYWEDFGVSLLIPTAAMDRGGNSRDFLNLNHRNSSLRYSLSRGDGDLTSGFHQFTFSKSANPATVYTVRKPLLVVTSVDLADGGLLYTRSDFRNGAWSTIMLSSSRSDQNLLRAVSASISPTRSPLFFIDNDGILSRAVDELLAFSDQRNVDSSAQPPSQPAAEVAANPPSRSQGSTGSGFFVSQLGHVLTNAHVVDACGSIMVRGQSAVLQAVSIEHDLALLKTEPQTDDIALAFSDRAAQLNSDVTVAGYPLAGLLGGLNVTRGSVSSLSGIGGNLTTMQITAPVQSGNSGGPVLSESGAVVGVVVSKLDARIVADALGDTPQNVNFAIRGEIAKLFLSANGVEPAIQTAPALLTPERLAETASRSTTFIECHP